jgi:hypothetical protein
MDVQHLTEDQDVAAEKWREYKDAAKKTRDPLYDDMKKVYYQIKQGKTVVNVFDAIKKGGIHTVNAHPKLAICQANAKEVFCRYRSNGTVFYSPRSFWTRGWRDRPGSNEFMFLDCLPQIRQDLQLKAPVPIIPPRLRPVKLTDDYYILWEVDHWTPMPSKDPYLLKRVAGNLFVVCAAWDLTDIEIAVMAGRVKS